MKAASDDYAMSGAGLSEGWTETQIQHVAGVGTGSTPLRSNPKFFASKGIPWITSAATSSHIVTKSKQFVTDAAVVAHRLKKYPVGTLLVAMYGEGKTRGQVTELGIEATINQACAAVVVDESVAIRKFVKFALQASYLEMREMAEGGNQPNLNLTKIKEFPLPLPPLAEQKRIAAKLEAVLGRVTACRARLDRVPTLLKRFRQSVLHAAVTGELTKEWRAMNQDVEPASDLLIKILAERRARHHYLQSTAVRKKKYKEPTGPLDSDTQFIPDGWKLATWDQVGLSQNGRPFQSTEYQSEGVRLLRPGNLHVSGKVVWNEMNTRCLPSARGDENPDLIVGPNELVMNLTAQSLNDEFLGRVCLTGEEGICLLNQRLARLTPILISSQFVMYLMKSWPFRRFVDRLNSGSLIQHMFTSQLAGFTFPLPPFPEQQEIVRRVEALFAMADRIEARLATAQKTVERLTPATLAKAFRGELVPQDPNDEPPRVLGERKASRLGTA